MGKEFAAHCRYVFEHKNMDKALSEVRMKQILAGGFLFVGGCILYAIGTLGFADTMVKAYMMQPPQYIGIISMLAGVILGILGLRKKD